jgi:type VI secretion system secreted protein Hcp
MAAYVKFEGIDGESTGIAHDKWSDLESFSQVISKPGSGTGATRRRGDVVLEDLACTKQIDKASPVIAKAVCNGKVFGKVEIHVTASYTGSSRETYFAYELKNVQVVRYALSGSGQAEQVPVEDFQLNFEEITVTYSENDPTGSPKGNVEYSWNVEEGH